MCGALTVLFGPRFDFSSRQCCKECNPRLSNTAIRRRIATWRSASFCGGRSGRPSHRGAHTLACTMRRLLVLKSCSTVRIVSALKDEISACAHVTPPPIDFYEPSAVTSRTTRAVLSLQAPSSTDEIPPNASRSQAAQLQTRRRRSCCPSRPRESAACSYRASAARAKDGETARRNSERSTYAAVGHFCASREVTEAMLVMNALEVLRECALVLRTCTPYGLCVRFKRAGPTDLHILQRAIIFEANEIDVLHIVGDLHAVAPKHRGRTR